MITDEEAVESGAGRRPRPLDHPPRTLAHVR